MGLGERITRLENRKRVRLVEIFFDRGNGLTPEETERAARAEAEGRKVIIFCWGASNEY